MRLIHGTEAATGKELHISYHNGDHYSSIRKTGDASETPANIKLENGILTGAPPSDKKKTKENDSYNTWDKEYVYDESLYNGDYGNTDYGDLLNDEDKVYGEDNNVMETIKRLTGCEDECLILQTLEDVGMDADIATEMVLKFMQTSLPEDTTSKESSSHESQLWDENGTGNRLFGGYEPVDSHIQSSSQDRGNLGAKPKQQQSGSQRKQNKKQEKKLRAQQRRRQERLGQITPSGGGSSDDDFTVVAMGTLKI